MIDYKRDDLPDSLTSICQICQPHDHSQKLVVCSRHQRDLSHMLIAGNTQRLLCFSTPCPSPDFLVLSRDHRRTTQPRGRSTMGIKSSTLNFPASPNGLGLGFSGNTVFRSDSRVFKRRQTVCQLQTSSFRSRNCTDLQARQMNFQASPLRRRLLMPLRSLDSEWHV